MELDRKIMVTHLFFVIISLIVLIVLLIFGFCFLWLLLLVLIAWIARWIAIERKFQKRYHEEKLKKLKKSAESRIIG
jgi:c-di-AMP phosphodiesterase-like protein